MNEALSPTIANFYSKVKEYVANKATVKYLGVSKVCKNCSSTLIASIIFGDVENLNSAYLANCKNAKDFNSL